MKAFTVYPWWGWAMVALGKAVENRTWKPPLAQGEWVAIHAGNRRLAGKSMGELMNLVRDAEAAGWNTSIVEFGHVSFGHPRSLYGVPLLAYRDKFAVRSAIVAVAQFNGATQGLPMPWGHATGYQWRLTSVMPLAVPVTIRGAQGLWTVPAVAVEKMRGQVPDAVFGGSRG